MIYSGNIYRIFEAKVNGMGSSVVVGEKVGVNSSITTSTTTTTTSTTTTPKTTTTSTTTAPYQNRTKLCECLYSFQ